MIVTIWSITTLLVMTSLAAEVPLPEVNDYDYETVLNEIPELLPYIANKEYLKKMHSLMNDNRGEKNDRTLIETNALINTKYRTWKRNADLINSLLALPKGMNDAGRR
ncbi:uncharacterized protein LOC114353182 [Ostrinia furnacalis]|uniref:uncharacterized protein LOC114353182 n=1 Tax=Ostrinia furnacalis TaxID=93504 RepID=UPI00103BCF02|nr:uncharacterized protein LOC114353182 [Ostrinia furnacalis]